jgi:hypothetical protein
MFAVIQISSHRLVDFRARLPAGLSGSGDDAIRHSNGVRQ